MDSPAIRVIAVFATAWIVAVTFQADFDLLSEWLTARAARQGVDPYQTISELAAHYGIDKTHDIVNPRTPGALLLFQPVGLVPVSWLPAVAVVGVTGLLCAAAFLYHPNAVVAVPVLLATWPGWEIAIQGHLSMAVLALSAVLVLRGGRAGGIAAGVATCLKLFPALWIVALAVTGRWQAFRWAAATVVALNVGGLLLPGVTFGNIIEGVGSGSRWVGMGLNGSLVSYGLPVWTVAVIAVGFVVFWPRQSLLRASLPASILLGPIAWISYLPVVLAALPARWATGMLGVWLAVRMVGWEPFTFGLQTTVFALVGLSYLCWRRSPESNSPGTMQRRQESPVPG